MFTDRTGETAAGAAPPALPYRFDRDLGTVPTSRDVARLVAEARAAGHAAGLAEGRASAEAAAAAALAAATTRVAVAAEGLLGGADSALAAIERDAVAVGLAAARRLAETLVEREPLAEIEALLAECLAPLRDVPHLVLRVREVDAEVLRPRMATMAAELGLAGRIVVTGDPAVAAGDCRLDWAEGSIVRRLGAAAERIERAFALRFAQQALPPPVATSKGTDRP